MLRPDARATGIARNAMAASVYGAVAKRRLGPKSCGLTSVRMHHTRKHTHGYTTHVHTCVHVCAAQSIIRGCGEVCLGQNHHLKTTICGRPILTEPEIPNHKSVIGTPARRVPHELSTHRCATSGLEHVLVPTRSPPTELPTRNFSFQNIFPGLRIQITTIFQGKLIASRKNVLF